MDDSRHVYWQWEPLGYTARNEGQAIVLTSADPAEAGYLALHMHLVHVDRR